MTTNLSTTPDAVTTAEMAKQRLDELYSMYRQAQAAADEAHAAMHLLTEVWGESEPLEPAVIATLRRCGVEPPQRKRLVAGVTGLVYYKGCNPTWDEAKLLAYLQRYHAARLDALTTRVVDVAAVEAAVLSGDVPGSVVGKYQRPPRPQAVFKVQ